ncbi:hypothetical protein KR76_00143 [Pimelobacter simplex]|uniref:Uncharacterized protein n=1 Tax=Nocardioides simplex TaxID=2045 RepID=A0A0C5XD08_NOCSI|nr:hypothetical protein KR76_00143 [Pimelobacter simplex]
MLGDGRGWHRGDRTESSELIRFEQWKVDAITPEGDRRARDAVRARAHVNDFTCWLLARC